MEKEIGAFVIEAIKKYLATPETVTLVTIPKSLFMKLLARHRRLKAVEAALGRK